jgi:hypothetical protein
MSKKSYLDRRADLIRMGYDKGKADALRNINPSSKKLNAEATAALIGMSEAEHAMGDQRLAYILRFCIDQCGDPDTVEALKKSEGVAANLVDL